VHLSTHRLYPWKTCTTVRIRPQSYIRNNHLGAAFTITTYKFADIILGKSISVDLLDQMVTQPYNWKNRIKVLSSLRDPAIDRRSQADAGRSPRRNSNTKRRVQAGPAWIAPSTRPCRTIH
jgi:hypothetical protein